MSYRSDNYMGLPGLTDAVESFSQVFTWGREELVIRAGANISGAARDSTNTPTTELRPGLLLGRLTASPELLKQYDPAATDGTQVVAGILMTGLRATDLDGNNSQRFAWMMVGGPIKAASLIGLDAVARAQMRGRFLFDDDLMGQYQNYAPYLRETAKTADYTVVAADAGTLFTTTGAAGAIIFTLPALAAGRGPFGFLNVVDQNMTVASAEGDNIVALHDASADSVAFSTASQKIGGHVLVWANAAGTKWYVSNRSAGANTITVAT
jgi:hypothetical protein